MYIKMENKTDEYVIDKVVVFTDGSCVSNGYQDAAAGYGIYFPNKELEDVSEPFTKKPITNQRAELYAIYEALKLIVRNLKFNKICVYTDSEYSIKCLTTWINDWKKNNWLNQKKQPVKNLDIIKIIKKIMDRYEGKIEFTHVRSHTGGTSYEAKCNDMADKLACKGTGKCRTKILPERNDVLYIDTNLDGDTLENLDIDKLEDIIIKKPKPKNKQTVKLKFTTEVYGD